MEFKNFYYILLNTIENPENYLFFLFSCIETLNACRYASHTLVYMKQIAVYVRFGACIVIRCNSS